MSEIELSAGTIEYQDTGGDGPVLVLLHGLMMDASLWDEVIAGLSAGHRCVAPTLPLGAHRHAMDPGADLSMAGIARLTAEFLDRLDLRDVTLVGNDTGGALVQLLMADDHPRDPPRHGADAPGCGRRYALPADGGRTAAGLRPARPHRLGQRGPGDAARARPAPGPAPPPGTAARGRRQLYAHPAGPACQA